MQKNGTYAWNFRLVDDGVLVLRAISQDSIGILKMVNGQFEFWHRGACVARTKSFRVLFKAINRVEAAT